jgi:hypothetical protein
MKLILLLFVVVVASLVFAKTPDQNCESSNTPCATDCTCLPLAAAPEELECVKDTSDGEPCNNQHNKCFPKQAGQHQACVRNDEGSFVCREVCRKK